MVEGAGAAMSYLTEEIASQPGCWAKAIELAADAEAEAALPRPGERVAAIGCGSPLNVARCYATLREAAGQGETDAFPASEVPTTRQYDRLVFISRTGTTTEVLDALRRAPRDTPTTAVTADPVHHQLDRAAPRSPGVLCRGRSRRGHPRAARRGRAGGDPAAAAGTRRM